MQLVTFRLRATGMTSSHSKLRVSHVVSKLSKSQAASFAGKESAMDQAMDQAKFKAAIETLQGLDGYTTKDPATLAMDAARLAFSSPAVQQQSKPKSKSVAVKRKVRRRRKASGLATFNRTIAHYVGQQLKADDLKAMAKTAEYYDANLIASLISAQRVRALPGGGFLVLSSDETIAKQMEMRPEADAKEIAAHARLSLDRVYQFTRRAASR